LTGGILLHKYRAKGIYFYKVKTEADNSEVKKPVKMQGKLEAWNKKGARLKRLCKNNFS